MFNNSHKIIFIVGPTAVGKSDVAHLLARKIQGEIVSCDSMQIYKEINTASNKPSQEVLKGTPHHLINIVSVEDEFDVAEFNRLALQAVKEIQEKNHTPVIVGGSGMYMQILLDGIFEGGPERKDLRQRLKHQAQERGNQYLFAALKEKDPNAAGRIHPNDIRRVIRALEVTMGERKPISGLQKKREGLWGKCAITIFGLNRNREELYARIDQRVDKMFQEGIVEEIKQLDGVPLSRTAKYIIGVQEILGYINGQYDLDHANDLMKLNTRRLAKHQLTWFRKDKRIHWMMMGPDDRIERIVEQMMEKSLAI
jgi:tRNA dimethylallyltransferase